MNKTPVTIVLSLAAAALVVGCATGSRLPHEVQSLECPMKSMAIVGKKPRRQVVLIRNRDAA